MSTTCEKKEKMIRASSSDHRKIIRTQDWLKFVAQKTRGKEKITKKDIEKFLPNSPFGSLQRDIEILFALTQAMIENFDPGRHYYVVIETPHLEIKFGFPQDPYLEKPLITKKAIHLNRTDNLWKYRDKETGKYIVPIVIHFRKNREAKTGILMIRDGRLEAKYISLDELADLLKKV